MRVTPIRAVAAPLLPVIIGLVYWWPGYGSEAKNFPGGLAFSDWVSTLTGGRNLPAHEGAVFAPKPLPPLPKPPHPTQSNIGYAGAHGDSYNSGVMPQAGPLGDDLVVHSRMTGSTFSGCSTQHFDPRGRVVTMCVGFIGSHLLLLDPSDLSILAEQSMPAMAGWYFRMDQQGQVIIPAGDFSLQIYRVDDSKAQPRWEQVARYDLGAVVPEAQRSLLVYRLDDVPDEQRLVCKIPVFKANKGSLENSFIGPNGLLTSGTFGGTVSIRDAE